VAAAVLATFSCRPSPRPAATAGRPNRVVALAPNLTEIVFALGAGASLVGVSDHSDFPPQARSIPHVGGLEVSAEKVASLSPDLVLATVEGNARGPVAALQAAGLRVVVLPSGSLDAVLAGIRLAAQALGRIAEGDRLVADIAGKRRAVRQRAAGRKPPRAILLVWPEPPQAAGGGTFLDDVLTESGAQNVFADRPGWPVVSAEYLATTPVDVLVLPTSPGNRAAFDRALAEGALSRGAVRRARVVRVDESEITRPGPRVFDAMERLARELHPGTEVAKRKTGEGR
jgi:iron complex transport system substrate-binding protein